jgi:uncharacterized FAD-dependent dehydrogenase
MSKLVHITIVPEQQADTEYILTKALQKAKLSKAHISDWRIRKRSIDARQKPVKLSLQIELFLPSEVREQLPLFAPQLVTGKREVCIIGAGPAGLYAALRALELGLKPIVYERGKDVRARRRDLAKIHKEHLVDPDSNYCFGEGGAGTFSDGKLYTRSKKRGNVKKAMEWFVHFGAPADILVDAHPHIGTNKLPKIIASMRDAIIAQGGEIHFESKLTDVSVEDGTIQSIQLNGDAWRPCSDLILATGHSARDIFHLLHKRGISMSAKAFALGVRVEHPQDLIDRIQYHGDDTNPFLPPASYALVTQVDGEGVYSFCMCPGGIVAPCATQQEEVVTNGWSPSKRNNPFANSGIVVSVDPERLSDYEATDPFVSLRLQQQVERACWEAAGRTQRVPAQRMVDFVEGKISQSLPPSSYQPGIVSVDLNTVLPPFIAKRLRKAFQEFGRKMKGYYTNEAVLHAPESRTSSPVSIPRDAGTLMHPEVLGLYPCGEGAGYAGGIISAAVDGMNCIEAIAKKYDSISVG